MSKLLFNEHGNDHISQRRIFGGETTNLMNLTNLKYDWAMKLYRTMMGNFWIPEEVSLGNDKLQYEMLTDKERREIHIYYRWSW